MSSSDKASMSTSSVVAAGAGSTGFAAVAGVPPPDPPPICSPIRAPIWPIVRARIRLVGGRATPITLSSEFSISTPIKESSPRSVKG